MNSRGDIVLSWFIKLILILSVLGIVAYEAGAVIVVRVGADGTAEAAAQEAASAYGHSHNVDMARAAALEKATQGGGKLVGFSISPDGQSVTVTVEKIAHTFLIQLIGPLKKFRIARATHTIKVT